MHAAQASAPAEGPQVDPGSGSGRLVRLDNVELTYLPFPMAVVRPVFPPDVYERLVAGFPPVEEFVYRPTLGHKYSLSEVNNPGGYRDFVTKNPIWRDFLAEIKSPEFVERWLRLLAEHNVDLGFLDQTHVGRLRHFRNSLGRLRRGHIGSSEFARRLRNRPRRTELRTRFEFSMLPADGGHIKPHTDAPQKLITLVFSMLREDEWDPAWGGGTCVVFVKTFNSLHSVPPIRGPEGAMRRTLTLNIERAGYV